MLAEGIRRGSSDSLNKFYDVFSRGFRSYLRRRMGHDLADDAVHDAFLMVVEAVQRGELRDAARLMGFARTVVARQMSGHVRREVARRAIANAIKRNPSRSQCPEQTMIRRQRTQAVVARLHALPARQREVLIRFYLDEQTPGEIQRAMGLTHTQFRLLKSRAKSKIAERSTQLKSPVRASRSPRRLPQAA